VYGCGGVGLSAVLGAVAVGATPIVVVDVAEDKLELALSLGATDAVRWTDSAEHTAELVRSVSAGGVDYAFEATGRTEAGEAAFLSTRPHGAAVLIGIPRAEATLSLPASQIVRTERRVLGSVYGSARPERDFPALLALYMRGRLPLDRLISARLPLEGVERAFDALRAATGARFVLDLDGGSA